MATYRYWEVRRDIYSQCSHAPLRKNRTFHEMKELFKTSYWVMLVGMLFCLCCFIVSLFVFYKISYISLIPVCVFLLLTWLSELFSDKMYNPSARQTEIDERAKRLDEYLDNANRILVSHGIKTKEQREYLHKECEDRLFQYDKGFLFAKKNTFDMLIGVPLGALISAVIFRSNSENTVILHIVLLIILGLAIIGTVNIAKKVRYYSDGCFKDRLLLDVLNELSYKP